MLGRYLGYGLWSSAISWEIFGQLTFYHQLQLHWIQWTLLKRFLLLTCNVSFLVNIRVIIGLCPLGNYQGIEFSFKSCDCPRKSPLYFPWNWSIMLLFHLMKWNKYGIRLIQDNKVQDIYAKALSLWWDSTKNNYTIKNWVSIDIMEILIFEGISIWDLLSSTLESLTSSLQVCNNWSLSRCFYAE